MIEKDDLDHYHGSLVRKIAIALANRDEKSWELLGCKTKTQWLDKSNKIIRELVNDSELSTEIKKIIGNNERNSTKSFNFSQYLDTLCNKEICFCQSAEARLPRGHS